MKDVKMMFYEHGQIKYICITNNSDLLIERINVHVYYQFIDTGKLLDSLHLAWLLVSLHLALGINAET